MHDHNFFLTKKDKKNKTLLLQSFILIAIFMAVEIIGGLLTNSLALLSDAFHMASDSIALLLSLIAFKLSDKPADSTHTYGYERYEVIAALINGLALVLLSIWIIYEAILRFVHPIEINAPIMIGVSLVGLIINAIVMFKMLKGDTNNLNMRGALLHVMGDLAGSAGAVIAGILIFFFGWNFVDPAISIVLSAIIGYNGFNLAKDSVKILAQRAPLNIDEVISALEKQFEIKVKDFHIWSMTSTSYIVSFEMIGQADLHQIKSFLTQFNIHHATIEQKDD